MASLSLLVGEAMAQGTPPEVLPQPPGGVGPLLQTAGALMLILGLLFFGFWLLKRYGGRMGLAMPGRGELRFQGQLALGGRRNVVVVRFLNKLLVLGVTDHQITLLTETDVPDERNADHVDSPDFAATLDKVSRRDKP